MTTLGALLVCLLLLLMLLGVLAWKQRRPGRVPEQPRTVADLVRMREGARPSDDDPAPDVVDREPTSADADAVSEPGEAPPLATGSQPELPTVDEQATTTEPAVGAASTPEDAAVDTPWARAARMAEPWMERSTEADEPEPPACPSVALLPPTYPSAGPSVTMPSPVRARPAASPAVLSQPASVPPPRQQVAQAVPPAESAPRAIAPVDVASSLAPSTAGVAESPPPSAVRGEAPAAGHAAQPETSPAPAVCPPAPTGPSDANGLASDPHNPSTQPAGTAPHLPTNGHVPVPAQTRVSGRPRRSPTATVAEQAAVDVALLRIFGINRPAADEPDVALEGCATDDDEPAAGAAQPVAFRVLARNGGGISGATVTLLDDHGRETASTRTSPEGRGVLTARHPGGYLLVIAADGYQPGAITVAVTDEPVDAEIPLARSASIMGVVGGEDGPIVGAQLVLVQDGEIVDTAQSAAEGSYRFGDLAAGEYGLSVTAHECERAALVLELADEADLRQDVELAPAGLPSDDVMIGPR